MSGTDNEIMEVDILIVGGGAAGLSAAYHLQHLISSHNESVSKGEKSGATIPDQTIMVIEKASEIGAHSFSGAVLNPIALSELIPNYREEGCPLEAEVTEDSLCYLTERRAIPFPITPPALKNEGYWIVSLSKLNRWLGKKTEDKGVNVLPGFAAVAPLIDGNRLVGVRTGDKGIDKNGNKKGNFEAGLLLKAKLTIFAEGPRGSLFKQVSSHFKLWEGKNPEVFEHGVKEVIQLPAGTLKPGRVIHTMGFPLEHTSGGGFLYTGQNDQLLIGLVGSLDTKDPLFDPHRELQKLKTHPYIAELISGGKVIAYGGKTLPAGGWYSVPKLYGHGFLVCGDSAGFVDVKRLKGIHLAMKSGMLAAETALEALLHNDFSEGRLKSYEQKVEQSYIKQQLFESRNFHQTLKKGFFAALPFLALQEITGGRGLHDQMPIEHCDAETTEPLLDVWGANGVEDEKNQLPKPDGVLFFDKLSSVYLTGTMHDENSPCHLLVPDTQICSTRCFPEYHSPCTHFCPANVYEMLPNESSPGNHLVVNFTNCIHCKACDIKCPFSNINWTPPEGGGGPKYQLT